MRLFSYFLNEIFLGQWLPTLSQSQLTEIQSNHERYVRKSI